MSQERAWEVWRTKILVSLSVIIVELGFIAGHMLK